MTSLSRRRAPWTTRTGHAPRPRSPAEPAHRSGASADFDWASDSATGPRFNSWHWHLQEQRESKLRQELLEIEAKKQRIEERLRKKNATAAAVRDIELARIQLHIVQHVSPYVGRSPRQRIRRMRRPMIRLRRPRRKRRRPRKKPNGEPSRLQRTHERWMRGERRARRGSCRRRSRAPAGSARRPTWRLAPMPRSAC